MAVSTKIHFFFEKQITLRQRNRLKAFLAKMISREGKKLEFLNYVFCTDKQLLSINRNYLNHDYYTDIITFNLSGNSQIIAGEVYISAKRVEDNARHFGVSLREELHRTIFHGALHLCGYDDKKDDQMRLMRIMEDKYLKKYDSEQIRTSIARHKSGRESATRRRG